jgi:hypothetical protein
MMKVHLHLEIAYPGHPNSNAILFPQFYFGFVRAKRFFSAPTLSFLLFSGSSKETALHQRRRRQQKNYVK